MGWSLGQVWGCPLAGLSPHFSSLITPSLLPSLPAVTTALVTQPHSRDLGQGGQPHVITTGSWGTVATSVLGSSCGTLPREGVLPVDVFGTVTMGRGRVSLFSLEAGVGGACVPGTLPLPSRQHGPFTLVDPGRCKPT